MPFLHIIREKLLIDFKDLKRKLLLIELLKKHILFNVNP